QAHNPGVSDAGAHLPSPWRFRPFPARPLPTGHGVRTTTANLNKLLLACGVVAGSLFMVVALVQSFTRPGFDLRRHAISMLSLGDLGWIQVTDFVVSGLLFLMFAVGVRRVLHPGRAGTWGPLLLCSFGAGLVIAGIFSTDPALGFPPGAPAGMPSTMS